MVDYRVGEEIYKEYICRDLLGEGGFGRVYRVENRVGQPFALKILFRNVEIERRGIEEVRNIRSMRLVSILDWGETKAGEYAILMEYVPGNLEKVLDAGPLNEDEACHYFKEILKGLTVLEDNGIVHRDIKPANLFLYDDVVKIGDFGTSKYTSGDSHSATQGLGTLSYMAPEQFTKSYGFSIDRWAAAVVLYQMLTGRLPFGGESYSEVFGSIMTSEPDLAGVPEKYREFLKRSFDKKVENRWADCGEMLRAFEELGREEASEEPPRVETPPEKIVVACPACGRKNRVPAGLDLTRVKCGSCKGPLEKGAMIGIDLGTAFSRICIWEGGESKCIPDEDGNLDIPSVVTFDDTGESLAGAAALRRALERPETAIFSIRRLIGRRIQSEDVQTCRDRISFQIGDSGDGEVAFRVGEKEQSPAEVLSYLLAHLKQVAEGRIGKRVTKAVITVPAVFSHRQCLRVREAAERAGIKVERLIGEAVAAGLAYGNRGREEGFLLLFHMGAGFCDVSVLEVGDGVYEVMATAGVSCLGGDDFDWRIVEWLAAEYERQHGCDPRRDVIASIRLKKEAERAKIALSTSPETEIDLPSLTADASGPKHLRRRLSREQFEALTRNLLDSVVAPVQQALADAYLKADDIDHLVPVGGMTRMPAVRQRVESFIGEESRDEVDAEQMAALGAAVQAGVIQGDLPNVLLLDATTSSLGIETLGGVMTKLIERNTTIPTRVCQIFSTAEDNQPALSIRVLRGEKEKAVENETIGRFELLDIPPAPKGEPQIEVTFDIDANGLLSVSAKDLGTGTERTVGFTDPERASTVDAVGGLAGVTYPVSVPS